ncbi:MAG: response regulator [Planctomycetota bacterium]
MATILIVDDEAAVRETLAALLVRQGHEVVEAADGVEALERFDEAPGAFDVIVSDVIMPRMNGFQLLQDLRPRLGDAVPFVILSSHEDDEGVRAAIYAGAFDYLFKPFDEARVADVVARALAASQGTRLPPSPSGPSQGAGSPDAACPDAASLSARKETAPLAPRPEAGEGVSALAPARKVVVVEIPSAGGSAAREEHDGGWRRLLARFRPRPRG